MAGAPDWQNLTATLPSKSQFGYYDNDATNVAAGASVQITVYSPVGTLVMVTGASLNMPSGPTGATTGNHELRAEGPAGVDLVLGTSTYDTGIIYDAGYWVTATTPSPPAAAGADQSYWLKTGTIITDDEGLVLTYYNNTDAAQTAARTWVLAGTEEDLP